MHAQHVHLELQRGQVVVQLAAERLQRHLQNCNRCSHGCKAPANDWRIAKAVQMAGTAACRRCCATKASHVAPQVGDESDGVKVGRQKSLVAEPVRLLRNTAPSRRQHLHLRQRHGCPYQYGCRGAQPAAGRHGHQEQCCKWMKGMPALDRKMAAFARMLDGPALHAQRQHEECCRAMRNAPVHPQAGPSAAPRPLSPLLPCQQAVWGRLEVLRMHSFVDVSTWWQVDRLLLTLRHVAASSAATRC